MDAEGSERERALERRIARLEARLDRLEGRPGPPVASTDAAPSAAQPAPMIVSSAMPSEAAAMQAPPTARQQLQGLARAPKPPAADPPQATQWWRPPEPGINQSIAILGQPAAPALAQ